MGYPHFSGDCSDYHDKVTDWGPTGRRGEVVKPEIVVLCGSTRFFDEFRRQNLALTVAGVIVLSIGCDTKADGDLFAAHGEPLDVLKARLDELHRRKIDLADRVLVLNVGGYIGESTRGEIDYAERSGKPITYLVSPYPTLADEATNERAIAALHDLWHSETQAPQESRRRIVSAVLAALKGGA